MLAVAFFVLQGIVGIAAAILICAIVAFIVYFAVAVRLALPALLLCPGPVPSRPSARHGSSRAASSVGRSGGSS